MNELRAHSPQTQPGPLAAVVLVHYGDPAHTRRCLESLLTCDPIRHGVYIADHGPGPDLEATLIGIHPDLHILKRNNDGFGAGCNAAAEAAFDAGAHCVWFLNNDATINTPVLSHLVELAQQYPQVGLWGTLQQDGTQTIGMDHLPRWFGESSAFATDRITILPAHCIQLEHKETLSGASILVTREAWDRLGPWPKWCFLYWEDVAWCLRAHAMGIPIVITDLRIQHERNTNTGHHSPLNTYYGVRNSLLLHRDLFPKRHLRRFFRGLSLLQKRFFQGRWSMLYSTWRGYFDACRNLRGKTF